MSAGGISTWNWITTAINPSCLLIIISKSSRWNFDVELKYEVLVRDAGSPSLSAVAGLTLIIEDVNDCPPQFTQSVYVFDVRENCQRGTAVGTVLAYDDDSWPFNVVRLVFA